MIGRYFGLKAFSELFGWVYSALALGASVGPVLTGTLYNWGGSYTAALIVAAGCSACTALSYLRLGPYPPAYGKLDEPTLATGQA